MVAISTDDVETLRRFKKETGAPYPLLSDKDGKVARSWAGLLPVVGLSKRANVVVGQDRRVKEVTEGGDAVDPAAAIAACPVR